MHKLAWKRVALYSHGMGDTHSPTTTSYIGASVAARILDRSVKSIHRYAEQGLLTPLGRLGTRTNSAVIFDQAEVEALAEKLNTNSTN